MELLTRRQIVRLIVNYNAHINATGAGLSLRDYYRRNGNRATAAPVE